MTLVARLGSADTVLGGSLGAKPTRTDARPLTGDGKTSPVHRFFCRPAFARQGDGKTTPVPVCCQGGFAVKEENGACIEVVRDAGHTTRGKQMTTDSTDHAADPASHALKIMADERVASSRTHG
jgi:hypothetical protein